MKKFLDRPNLKLKAKQELKGDYRTAVPVTVFTLLCVGLPCAGAFTGLWFAFRAAGLPVWGVAVLSAVLTELLFVVLKGPISYGSAKYYLNMSRNEPLEVHQLFAAFNRANGYFKAVWLKFLQIMIWIAGTALFIVPGIVWMYRYSMAFYALADSPGMTAREAFRRSRELTDGNKPDLFALDLSYLGWYALSSLTCGLLLLYVAPNLHTTKAYYYNVMAEKVNEIKPKIDRNYAAE